MKPSERTILKNPQVPSLAGRTINVLVDLGNCYDLNNGHNKLNKDNVDLFIQKSSKNYRKFDKDCARIYKRDLALLKMAFDSFNNYTAALGELCRAFYKLKFNDLNSPSKEEKFLSSITKRLGNSAEDIVEL